MQAGIVEIEQLGDLAERRFPEVGLQRTVVDRLDDALAGGPADAAAAIAAALNSLSGSEGITINATAVGEQITLDLGKTASVSTDTATVDLSSGVAGFDFDLSASTNAQLSANLAVSLQFDAAGLRILDTATPELTVGVDANVSVVDAAGKLGFINITASDRDLAVPEVSLDFSFDLLTGDALAIQGVEADITGTAALDLVIASDVSTPILPSISTNLFIGFPPAPGGFGSPTVELRDIKLDLGDYFGLIKDSLGSIISIMADSPLGTILDIATGPLPVVNYLAEKAPFLLDILDTIPTEGGDNVISIVDLAVLMKPELAPIVSPFVKALGIINAFAKLNDAEPGVINFGNGGFSNGSGTLDANGNANPLQQLSDKAKADPGLLSTLGSLLDDFTASTGISLPILENPLSVIDLILGLNPVKLVEYDVPKLGFETGFSRFFPIVGPIGATLSGNLEAAIDFAIGYDTYGFLNGVNDPLKGFYFTTDTQAGTPHGFAPVGFLDTRVGAAATVNAVVVSAGVGIDLGFRLDAYFEEATDPGSAGLFRPAGDFSCIFDPITGRAYAEALVILEFGIGPFSYETRLPLANVTLAEFDVFKCPDPGPARFPEGEGLATVVANGLRLNVGDFANLRRINDNGTPKQAINPDNAATPENESENESYVVALARDRVGPSSIGPGTAPQFDLVPGQLDIHAFGFTQRLAEGIIRAEFKGGRDTLIVQSDVTQNVIANGGGGDDVLTSARGIDTLLGEDGNDYLTGGDGIDAGPGVPVEVTFQPGGPATIDLTASVPLSNPDRSGVITYSPSNPNVSIAPTVIDILPPNGLFTPGDDVVDLNAFDLSIFTLDQTQNALAGNDTVRLSETQAIGQAFDGDAGDDTITGSASGDIISDTLGAKVAIEGGGGDDTLVIGGTFTSGTIDGGIGRDKLAIASANGSASLVPLVVSNIESITLENAVGTRLTVASPEQAEIITAAFGANDVVIVASGSLDHEVVGDLILGAGVERVEWYNSFYGSASAIREGDNYRITYFDDTATRPFLTLTSLFNAQDIKISQNQLFDTGLSNGVLLTHTFDPLTGQILNVINNDTLATRTYDSITSVFENGVKTNSRTINDHATATLSDDTIVDDLYTNGVISLQLTMDASPSGTGKPWQTIAREYEGGVTQIFRTTYDNLTQQVVGQAGTQVIQGGAFNDVLLGGAGADQFRSSAAGFGKDKIFDFQDGSDLLDLTGLGIDTRAELDAAATVRQVGANTLIELNGGADSILISNLQQSNLTDLDFFR